MLNESASAGKDCAERQARFIAAPMHPALRALLAYWTEKRGPRLMPARSDLHPREIKPLLPYLHLWNAQPPYVIRLVGGHIAQFDGINYTGEPATAGLPPNAAAMLLHILDQVTATKAPLFRAGKAYWSHERSYRDFEACYLPLSADDASVDMILGGYIYDMA